MFFKTADEQLLQKVLAGDAADRRKLARMEADLEALRPKWLAIQIKLEALCSAYADNDRSYARPVYEPFWRDREAELKRQIEKLIAERDALTAVLPAEIAALKGQIHNRRSMATGDFGSWVSQISLRLPSALAAEVEQARRDIATLTDLGEVFTHIGRVVEKVGELDEGTALPPLLNVAAIVRRLAG
jgi:hypothetical protein